MNSDKNLQINLLLKKFNKMIETKFLDLHKSGVYILSHIKSNKIYIGSSSNIRMRIYEHRSQLRRNKHDNKNLQEAYNDDIKILFYILLVNDKEEALDIEQKILDYYKSSNKIFNIAINSRYSTKGIKLPNLSEHLRKEIRERNIRNWKNKDYREKQMKIRTSKTYKEKIGAKSKLNWENLDFRNKVSISKNKKEYLK